MTDRANSEIESEGGFDDFEYVNVVPPMVAAEAIGDFDGKCSVAYHGAAGRCTGEPEYKTTIDRTGGFEYVALCSKHAEMDGGPRE